MMLAARELNIEKLPESSRNWINEKLIYTHGYGVTMNPVNGFTPEGLPTLVLSNMPVQSTIPGFTVTRPEIYFGELTNTDVYVKTRQKEFNYPQGETNNQTSYEGEGGIRLGGFLRRLLIALDRGDIAKLPFSDDITPDSRLLMRRNISERVEALAPFLTYDPDPYVVVSRRWPYFLDAGRLHEIRARIRTRGTTCSVASRSTTCGTASRSSSTPTPARRRSMCSTTTTRSSPRIEASSRRSFARRSTMPPGLRKHVRYPELLLKLQAAVYGLYHMTDPDGVLQPRGLCGRWRRKSA